MGSCCKPEEYTTAQQHVTHKPSDAIHESVKVCTKGLATELLWPWPHIGGMLLWYSMLTRQFDMVIHS